MPWLPIYADQADVAVILSDLNEDADICFIIADGAKRWRAVHQLDRLTDGRYCIWIHSAGPLPLLRPDRQPPGLVSDPWLGWTELRTGANPTQPYFGTGDPKIIWFNVLTTGKTPGAIGLSGFEWIGNRYGAIGRPAPGLAERCWRRLGRKIKKTAKRIPRQGPLEGPNPEIWACPSALASIVAGKPRDKNPGIRNVEAD